MGSEGIAAMVSTESTSDDICYRGRGERRPGAMVEVCDFVRQRTNARNDVVGRPDRAIRN